MFASTAPLAASAFNLTTFALTLPAPLLAMLPAVAVSVASPVVVTGPATVKSPVAVVTWILPLPVVAVLIVAPLSSATVIVPLPWLLSANAVAAVFASTAPLAASAFKLTTFALTLPAPLLAMLPAVAVSQAVEGYGIEGQGWDEMLRGVHWEAAAQVASAVVGGIAGHGILAPMVVNLNVPNLPLAGMAGWERTVIGRVPPRVIADARLEPHEGRAGSYKVVMEWGDAVSLPEGTDGGAVERDRVSLTLLGHLSDIDTPRDGAAEQQVYPALARALDGLFTTAP